MRSLWVSLALPLLLVALAAPADAARKQAFKKSDFKDEYRATLTRWAQGEAQGAVADLVELESRNSGEGKHLDGQWKAKLSVVRDLVGRSPQLLVPLSQLHQRAYLSHLERGAYQLAAHSRSLTMELAELYAERVKGTRDERFASAIMTSLAGHLHAAFIDSTATALYQRAAEIDANNVAALLGQVGIHERHGEYDEALPLLERVVETAPTHAEGRLRLAIQLARIGRRAESERQLRSLADERPREPGWIYSLAYQELARLLFDREEFDEALAQLEIATRALPGDPTLPILLAYASDRVGRPSSKAKLAASLHEAAASGAESPRYRYSQMPQGALAQLRQMLEGETSAQLATLAEALGAPAVLAATGGE